MSKKNEEILGYSKGIPITQSVIDELAAEVKRLKKAQSKKSGGKKTSTKKKESKK